MTAVARPLVAPDWATLANYGAGPYPGFANKQQPSAGKIAEGFDPADYLPAEWLNWALNNHGQWINYLDAVSTGFWFGDGSDGVAVADGVAAVPGCSLSFGNYSANRDLNFSNFTLNAGKSLSMNGFRLYATGQATINGTLSHDGSQNLFAGVLATIGLNGTGGAIGGVGGNGAAVTVALGGRGGAGGIGSGGFAGGAAGTIAAPTGQQGSIHNPLSCISGLLFGFTGALAANGGSGGGGGGGDAATQTGARGGRPGGVLFIVARTAYFGATASLSAQGEVGLTTSSGGSGGGGGGGAVVVTCLALATGSVDPATLVNVSPGAGGPAGAGGGGAGAAGIAGNSYIFIVASGTLATLPTPTHVEEGNITVAGNATVTANFGTPFAAAPPNVGGYKFRWDIAVTDGGPAPTIRLTALTINSMTWTIDSDNFNGVLSWRATA